VEKRKGEPPPAITPMQERRGGREYLGDPFIGEGEEISVENISLTTRGGGGMGKNSVEEKREKPTIPREKNTLSFVCREEGGGGEEIEEDGMIEEKRGRRPPSISAGGC